MVKTNRTTKPQKKTPRPLEDNGLLEHIGQIIYDARREKHWTQEELGEKLDRTKMTILRWEKGKSDPGIAGLVELAQLFEGSALFQPIRQALNVLRQKLSSEVTKSVNDNTLQPQG